MSIHVSFDLDQRPRALVDLNADEVRRVAQASVMVLCERTTFGPADHEPQPAPEPWRPVVGERVKTTSYGDGIVEALLVSSQHGLFVRVKLDAGRLIETALSQVHRLPGSEIWVPTLGQRVWNSMRGPGTIIEVGNMSQVELSQVIVRTWFDELRRDEQWICGQLKPLHEVTS